MIRVLILSFLMAGGALLGCYTYTTVEEDLDRPGGVIAEELYETDLFERIRISGSFSTTVTAGIEPSVTFIGDQSDVDRVRWSVSGETLSIGFESGRGRTAAVEVEITVPIITEVHVSGSNRIDLLEVDTESLELRSSGSSRISASGTAGQLSIRSSGSARIDTSQLSALEVSVITSGSSRIEVFASEKLEARTSGSSRVVYFGEPSRVNTRVSGSGRIESGY